MCSRQVTTRIMLTCNFHRDWKYLSIISSSGHIFGLCKIFSCFVLSCGGVRAAYYYPDHGGVIIILEIVTGHRMHSDQTRACHVKSRDTCPGVAQYYQENASPCKSWRSDWLTFIIWRTLVFRIFWHGTPVLVTKLLQVLQLFVSSPNGDKTAHLFLLRRARGSGARTKSW